MCLFMIQNTENLWVCFYMNQFNKMMRLYLIYLILEYIFVLRLEEVLVDPMVAGYGLVSLVKLLMFHKLKFRLGVKVVPWM